MKQYPSLIKAYARENYKIELQYENGEKKLYDFLPELQHPFYKELQDEKYFIQMSVQNGELVWMTGQDFCPNTLYEKSVLL
ncbi:MAG: DUF2442 domain-containing protein [Lachnospiraceae bacterium]|nr:DUF2442 domain-containing protein [Lachnospiraceae bacterium]